MKNINDSMEQLRRSLDERMNEIRRRNEEFMNRYSQPYGTNTQEEKQDEEELRFCEECGARVSVNALFCEQCGCRLDEELDEDTINTFADDGEEDDDISASSSSEPRTLRISFGGQRGHMIRQYDYEDEIVNLLLKIMDKCIEEGNYIDAKRASTNSDVMHTYNKSTKILYKLIDCMKENGATEEEMQEVLDRIYRYGIEEELVPVYKYAVLKPMDI